MKELDNTKPIILCCASGSRSALAKRTLLANGFENVHNAGKWNSLIKF
jgi:rhodanese-related sulfurtransferase